MSMSWWLKKNQPIRRCATSTTSLISYTKDRYYTIFKIVKGFSEYQIVFLSIDHASKWITIIAYSCVDNEFVILIFFFKLMSSTLTIYLANIFKHNVILYVIFFFTLVKVQLIFTLSWYGSLSSSCEC